MVPKPTAAESTFRFDFRLISTAKLKARNWNRSESSARSRSNRIWFRFRGGMSSYLSGNLFLFQSFAFHHLRASAQAGTVGCGLWGAGCGMRAVGCVRSGGIRFDLGLGFAWMPQVHWVAAFGHWLGSKAKAFAFGGCWLIRAGAAVADGVSR
jgi:hypothetical protein